MIKIYLEEKNTLQGGNQKGKCSTEGIVSGEGRGIRMEEIISKKDKLKGKNILEINIFLKRKV